MTANNRCSVRLVRTSASHRLGIVSPDLSRVRDMLYVQGGPVAVTLVLWAALPVKKLTRDGQHHATVQ